MSLTRTARVPTTSGSRYLQQLCKHWAHKFETRFDASAGHVDLPMGRAAMVAEDDMLVVTLTVEDPDMIETMQDVVAKHLDRFAFREAPLPFDWQQ
jgi:hypothetical protein